VDYKDWTILKAIYEEQCITKAAERLYLSQPALSKRLKSMENELGTKIVLRNSTGIIFTPEGKYLLTYALDALQQLARIKERIENMRNIVCGTLNLGASSVFAHCELPKLLPDFIAAYPNVDISVKTGLSSKITKMLQKDELAVAVVRGDHFWSDKRCLLREEYLCLASLKPVEFAELPKLPRVNYGTDSGLKDTVQNWWHETFNCQPNIFMEVDSMDTCREMVLHGLGWAILPEIALQGLPLYTQKLFRQDGTPVLRRTWLFYRHEVLELSAVNAFVHYLENYYYVKRGME
jgi:DNA-binding transcriptional LysR family regulator